MGKIEVTILGQKYSVKGDAPEDYIRSLAAFVDGKLKEVYSTSPHITPLKAAILTSLNIADELQKLKEAQESISRDIRDIEEKTNALTGLFD